MYHKLSMENQSMFTKLLFENLKGQALTAGQPKILEYLGEHDGAVQKEIANACFIEPATVTSLLARMENSGLVTREMKKENRRYLHVFLTPKGRDAVHQVKRAFEVAERSVFENFSQEEEAIFLNLLRRIHHNLKRVNDSE